MPTTAFTACFAELIHKSINHTETEFKISPPIPDFLAILHCRLDHCQHEVKKQEMKMEQNKIK